MRKLYKELRLGNYVIGASRGGVHEVDLGILDHLKRYKSGYGAIVLTDEWLDKLGFETGEAKPYRYLDLTDKTYIYHNTFNERIETGIVISNEDSNGNELESCNELGIKYVHQLQNLYFALTGKELQYEK